MTLISDLKVAVLLEEGAEQSEIGSVREALEQAGITVDILSTSQDELKVWDRDSWGIRIKVDYHITEVNPDNYDGLLLPDGILHTDELRMNNEAVDFVKHFFSAGKCVGAIGHAPHILINAGVVEGKKLTSMPNIRTDLVLEGAIWLNEQVINDNGLITSRYPEDIEAFIKIFIEELREGIHQRTATII